METLTIENSENGKVISEEEKIAVVRIKKWVSMICRKKCSDSNRIYVSPYVYKSAHGDSVAKTVICISDNLPDGPVIQIPKPITEVGLEDLLTCYKLINFCTGKKSSD